MQSHGEIMLQPHWHVREDCFLMEAFFLRLWMCWTSFPQGWLWMLQANTPSYLPAFHGSHRSPKSISGLMSFLETQREWMEDVERRHCEGLSQDPADAGNQTWRGKQKWFRLGCRAANLYIVINTFQPPWFRENQRVEHVGDKCEHNSMYLLPPQQRISRCERRKKRGWRFKCDVCQPAP